MNLPKEDLDHILDKTKNYWQQLSQKTIFLTGGTGFFGIWLQQSFLYANANLGLQAKMIVLTRNKAAFSEKYPNLALHPAISLLEGDIGSFSFPEEPIEFIIHAATDASVALMKSAPLQMFDTIVPGTRRVLDLAVNKNVQSILITSSGAIYGQQPSEMIQVAETYTGGPQLQNPLNIYAEGKRMAEMLSAVYHTHFGVPVKIARCFAFVGPLLPLDAHFAIGNFMNDLLNKRDIHINSDGTSCRSYLYASDLAIWLWTILFKGKNNHPYNTGSDQSISIEQLAKKMASYQQDGSTVSVKLALSPGGAPVNRYVPNIERAITELDVQVYINLDEAIQKTFNFYSKTD